MALEDLYQSILLDHSRNPRRFAVPADQGVSATERNPLCGDTTTVMLDVDVAGNPDREPRIARYFFHGEGCAISIAAASLLGDMVEGKTRAEALAACALLERVIDGQATGSELEPYGDIACLSALAAYPARKNCALLALRALRAALDTNEVHI